MKATESNVRNGEVTLAMTSAGDGKKLIFFNGAGSTQVIWKQVLRRLKGQYEIITFDFRNHGKASASENLAFDALLSDAEAVMDRVGSGRPIVVAWSLGADLAVTYAASHPGVIGGLVIIDGAVPISESLVEDEAKMRRSINSGLMKLIMFLMRFTPYRYKIDGDTFADMVVDVNHRRQHILDEYAKIDCPITMMLATKSLDTARKNRLWREGAERLAAKHSSIRIEWLEAGHKLAITHPAELAHAVDNFASHIQRDEVASESARNSEVQKAVKTA